MKQKKFVALFAKLRETVDHQPVNVISDAKGDEEIQKLCEDVVAVYLESTADLSTKIAAGRVGVDANFIRSVREYEAKYADVVTQAWLDAKRTWAFELKAELGESIYNLFLAANKAALHGNEVVKGRAPKPIPELEADLIEHHLLIANSWLKGEAPEVPAMNGSPLTWTGIDTLLQILRDAEFSLAALVEGWQRSTETYIPDHVSSRSQNRKQEFLHDLLTQANRSILFGAPAGSIALMRSIVESVLVEHYRSSGRDLSEIIDNARGLPKNARASDLHRLRLIANRVLHDASTGEMAVVCGQIAELSSTAGRLLLTVRDLVEGIPG